MLSLLLLPAFQLNQSLLNRQLFNNSLILRDRIAGTSQGHQLCLQLHHTAMGRNLSHLQDHLVTLHHHLRLHLPSSHLRLEQLHNRDLVVRTTLVKDLCHLHLHCRQQLPQTPTIHLLQDIKRQTDGLGEVQGENQTTAPHRRFRTLQIIYP